MSKRAIDETRSKQFFVDQMIQDMLRADKKLLVLDCDGTILKGHTCHDEGLQGWFEKGSKSVFSGAIKSEEEGVTQEKVRELFADFELFQMILDKCEEKGIAVAIASKQSHVALRGLMERAGIPESKFTAGIHGNPYPDGLNELREADEAVSEPNPFKRKANGGNKAGFIDSVVATGWCDHSQIVYCDDAELHKGPKRGGLELKGVTVFGGKGEIPAIEQTDYTVRRVGSDGETMVSVPRVAMCADGKEREVSFVNGNIDSSQNGLNFENLSKLAQVIKGKADEREASSVVLPDQPLYMNLPNAALQPAQVEENPYQNLEAIRQQQKEAIDAQKASQEPDYVNVAAILSAQRASQEAARTEAAANASTLRRDPRPNSAPLSTASAAESLPKPIERPQSAPARMDKNYVSVAALTALASAQARAEELSSKQQKRGFFTKLILPNLGKQADKIMREASANFAEAMSVEIEKGGLRPALSQEGLDAIGKNSKGNANVLLKVLADLVKQGVTVEKNLKVQSQQEGQEGGQLLHIFLDEQPKEKLGASIQAIKEGLSAAKAFVDFNSDEEVVDSGSVSRESSFGSSSQFTPINSSLASSLNSLPNSNSSSNNMDEIDDLNIDVIFDNPIMDSPVKNARAGFVQDEQKAAPAKPEFATKLEEALVSMGIEKEVIFKNAEKRQDSGHGFYHLAFPDEEIEFVVKVRENGDVQLKIKESGELGFGKGNGNTGYTDISRPENADMRIWLEGLAGGVKYQGPSLIKEGSSAPSPKPHESNASQLMGPEQLLVKAGSRGSSAA